MNKIYIFLLLILIFSIQTNAQQLSGYKLCIDPGHGGHDPSNDRKINLPYGIVFWESEGNLMTALNLDTILIELGANVKLTRTSNTDADDLSLSTRSQIANDFGADYFHSIHTNGYNGQDNYSLVLYKGTDQQPAWTKAKEMADIMSPILYSVMRTTGHYVHGDYSFLGFNLGVLKNTQMPATLSEGAFHDYPESGLRLKSLWFSKNYAWGIAKSFLQYFNKSGFAKGRVGGVIYDSFTHEPVNNVTVTLSSENISCTTDDYYNGFYALDINPGTYTLTIDKDGYVTKNVSVTITANEYNSTDIQIDYYNDGNPRADFYIVGLPAGTGSLISFVAKNSIDPDGTITAYDWSFGDGNTASGDSVTHAYTIDSTYAVQLIVTDNDNKKDTLVKNVVIQTNPPSAPNLLTVVNITADDVKLSWSEISGAAYRIYISKTDEMNDFSLIVDENTLSVGTTEYTISDLEYSDKGYNFYVTAINAAGESEHSDTYSYYRSNDTDVRNVLIVDGYDRLGSWGAARHQFSNTYMASLRDAVHFNIASAANEALTSSLVNLGDYDIVLWFLGDESTADITFSYSEQILVKEYLEAGGNLIVTGSEIAWDLDNKGNATDKAFIHDYFKAAYAADGIINNNPAIGASGSYFSNISLNFGQVYPEDYPDELNPIDNSEKILVYKNGAVAGLAYKGFFGNSTDTSALIYIAFPLETVSSDNELINFMQRAINYFYKQFLTSTDDYLKHESISVFPVPTHDILKIKFEAQLKQDRKIYLYNLSGQTVFEQVISGAQLETQLSLEHFHSGSYILKILQANKTYIQKIVKK